VELLTSKHKPQLPHEMMGPPLSPPAPQFIVPRSQPPYRGSNTALAKPSASLSSASATSSYPSTQASDSTGTSLSSAANGGTTTADSSAPSSTGVGSGTGTSNTSTRQPHSSSRDKEKGKDKEGSKDPGAMARTRMGTPYPPSSAASTPSVLGLGGGGGTAGGSALTQPMEMSTPQTGASRMAAAAKRGQIGLSLLSMDDESTPKRSTEDHPLSEKSLAARDYKVIHTLNRQFHLPNRWELIRPLGQGAYGLVIQVQDTISGEPVAVKCITRVFDKVILARRALREITLLRHFGGHENLTGCVVIRPTR